MKKITLLFTILCASALSAMEPERSQVEWENLPKALIPIMNTYLIEYNNLDDMVNDIKKATQELNTMINEKSGNLAAFTEFIHVLSYKFNKNTFIIATKFGTPAAKAYLDLGNKLIKASNTNDIKSATQLLKQGADPNFSDIYIIERIKSPLKQGVTIHPITTPLLLAIRNGNIELITLLLDNGAKPESDAHYDANDAWTYDTSKLEKIKQLLENARRK
ncbi:MAG TPA: hypothetical protein VJ201_06220 [Candidatus Babeliales bacterium]|nr:hypothetical protein [Candidatus Babeliales bacterium]